MLHPAFSPAYASLLVGGYGGGSGYGGGGGGEGVQKSCEGFPSAPGSLWTRLLALRHSPKCISINLRNRSSRGNGLAGQVSRASGAFGEASPRKPA